MDFYVKRIGKENASDINIKNEPFSLCGRMLVERKEGRWSWSAEYFAEEDIRESTFPDENYDFDQLTPNSIFVGAYTENGTCIGLAIYQHAWNKYLYLYDLKVNAAYRRCGIGRMLIEEGKRAALEHGYRGIFTQGQDNNLNACLFYVKNGFQIGGMDTMVYCGTKQEGKSDILFYLDCE